MVQDQSTTNALADKTAAAVTLAGQNRVVTVGKGKDAKRIEYTQPDLTFADVSERYEDCEVGAIRAAFAKPLTAWKAAIKAAGVFVPLDSITIAAVRVTGGPQVTTVDTSKMTDAQRKVSEGLSDELRALYNIKLV